MRIDPEDFRRHYAMLSDEALFALNRAELIDVAQACYDQEVAKRKAERPQDEEDAEEVFAPLDDESEADEAFEVDAGPEPEWLDEAACACTFSLDRDTPDLARARGVLKAAGIPCYVTVEQIEEPPRAASGIRNEYRVLVPGALNLNAASVLDRDLFNAEHEENWRVHLEALSDEELGRLSPKVFCAGLLDRAARMKKAYEEEVARRKH